MDGTDVKRWWSFLTSPLFRLAYLTYNGGTMTAYGPDNPRPWDPNDPLLKSPAAPHETRATMRLHRAGWSGEQIIKELKIRGTKLMHSLQQAMKEEDDAHRANRPIHDALVEKGTK